MMSFCYVLIRSEWMQSKGEPDASKFRDVRDSYLEMARKIGDRNDEDPIVSCFRGNRPGVSITV